MARSEHVTVGMDPFRQVLDALLKGDGEHAVALMRSATPHFLRMLRFLETIDGDISLDIEDGFFGQFREWVESRSAKGSGQ